MSKSHDHKGESAGAVSPGKVGSASDVPKERSRFRALIVANPNYFGNIATSAFAPVEAIQGNTTYEQIGCVGFHPQANRLEAVVFTTQPYGYGGDVCSAGTPEYVRFYLSFDNGATWDDQGVTNFTAYDIPLNATGGKRLEHAVSIACSPSRKWCTVPNLILARAILSWNDVPPANTPNHVPVWGNIHNTHIQVDPTGDLKWVEFLKLSEVKLPLMLAESLDLQQAVPASPKKALSVAQLHELYKGRGVEPHRYLMAEVQKLIKTPELTANLAQPFTQADKLGIKLADVVSKMLETDGNTLYEELDCIGLRPTGMSGELVGVLRIKRKAGYSGGPCTDGSREYVTFWADFDNNGTYETCLGTTSVQVFDLEVPPEGLEYAVHLPVDLNPFRRPCQEGPRVVPIRAILSWNDVPDCGNPNWVPTWGNREDTMILIPPGSPATGFNPFLYEISGAAVCSIDPSTGQVSGVRPFGGTLCISGEIPGALSLAAADSLEYKLWATQGSTTIPLIVPFSLTVEEGTGPASAISYSIAQAAGGDGYFTYREHGTPMLGSWRRVSSPNRLLAYWNTSGLTGTWTIHVQARAAGTLAPIYAAGVTTCPDGTVRSSVTVTLDQEAPVATLELTGYSDANGLHPALPCGDFTKGVTILGTFDVTDNMGVGSYGISVKPSGAVSVTVDPGSTTTHVFGTWQVATGALDPCGYVVEFDAYDRTIVNCGTSWHDDDSVGFCLRSPA